MAPSSSPLTECPICGAAVPGDATECPQCGEAFEPWEDPTQPIVSPGKVPRPRDQLLHNAGIALILLGGPGIALGSWVHDVLRISFLNYNSFDVFGPMNRMVLAVGLIVTIAGVALLILSPRLTRPAERDAPA